MTDFAIRRALEKKSSLSRADVVAIGQTQPGGNNRTVLDESDNAAIVIESNRMWIPNDMYDALLSYHNTVLQYVRDIPSGAYDIDEIRSRLDQTRNAAVEIFQRYIP